MVLNKFYTILVLFLIGSSAFAGSDIKFEVLVHDFGLVKEGDKATKVFDFKNTGLDSLQLENVRASCGCTVPNWPKNTFATNDQGEIKVTYNSSGRVGPFYKVITITTMEFEKVELVIKGVVIAEENFDESVPSVEVLELEKQEIALGKLELNKSVDVSATLKNMSNDTVSVTSVKAGCRCVSYLNNTVKILPQMSAEVKFKYTPRKLGEDEDILVLQTDSKNQPGVELKLSSVLVESFAPKSSNILNNGETAPASNAFGF